MVRRGTAGMRARACSGALAAVLAGAAVGPDGAVGLAGIDACMAGMAGSAERVSCRIGYELGPPERAELGRLTGGALVDADCELAVDLARGPLFEALLRPEVLDVPPQDGRCRVATTRGGPLDVAFLVAPRVRFAEGRAVAATPNVHGVRGLPNLLAVMLTEAVNRSPLVEAALVREINAFLDQMAP